MPDQEDLLRPILARSPIVTTVVDRWPQIGLPATHGISDIDLVYFDGNDLSEETEAGHATRVRALFADLGLWIDVKNEARVHLWYAEKFGPETLRLQQRTTQIKPYSDIETYELRGLYDANGID